MDHSNVGYSPVEGAEKRYRVWYRHPDLLDPEQLGEVGYDKRRKGWLYGGNTEQVYKTMIAAGEALAASLGKEVL